MEEETDFTAVVTRLVTASVDQQQPTVVAEIGRIPLVDYAHSTLASHALQMFSAPSSHATSPVGHSNLLAVAIALPVCLAAAFLLLGFLIWWQRHRIVQDLHRRYFGPDFSARPFGYHETKRWSADNSPSAGTPLEDLPIRVCDSPDTHRLPPASSERRTPENPLRSLGTPNFPGPRQHLMEKPRCITPDTPSGRREQLESRAQLIQEVHLRAREGSLTPDVLDHRPRQVVSLDRVNEEWSELERPSSPSGSIRVVEAAYMPRRTASDAISARLDEVFQPHWSPKPARRSLSSG